MRRWIILLIGLLVSIGVQAQETTNYRLRVPSAEEYLAAIPSMVEQIRSTAFPQDRYAFEEFMNEEFWSNYAYSLDEVPLDVLLAAGHYIYLEPSYGVYPNTVSGWHQIVFNRWIAENEIELESQEVWQFDDYTLETQLVDFTGDDQSEIIVHLMYQSEDYVDFEEFFVLQRNPATTPKYKRLGETHFWFAASCPYQLSCGGSGKQVDIMDVTGDGLPEWLLSREGCGYGICYVGLEIYSWVGSNENRFRLVSPNRLSIPRISGGGGAQPAPDGTWSFDNTDDDASLEMLQFEEVTDNRDCSFTIRQDFDWNDELHQYEGGEEQFEYDESFGCELRLAHIAMQELDFQDAMRHYEALLEYGFSDEQAELSQYVRLRLAIAYSMVGELAKAEELLAELTDEAETSTLMKKLVDSSYEALTQSRDPLRLCNTVFDIIRINGETFDAGDSDIRMFAQSNDYSVSWNYGGGDFSGSNAGCNIYGLWERSAENLDSSSDMVEQIEADGWTIADIYQIDLNEDGIDEIFVWNDIFPNSPILRWSYNGMINFESPSTGINFPDALTEVDTIQLPGVEGNALVQIRFDSSLECQLDSRDYPGSIRVWGITDTGLSRFAYTSICAPQTIAETFPTPEELHIVEDIYGEAVVLFWDSNALSFSRYDPSDDVSSEQQEFCIRELYGICAHRDTIDETIGEVEAILTDLPDDATPEYVQGLSYFRATLLVESGQEDQALAKYIAIYEAAPESAWGMLAALHIEPNE